MTTRVVVEPAGTTVGTTVKISISIVVTTLEEMHRTMTIIETTIDADAEDRTTIEGGTTIDGMNTGIGSTIGIAVVVDLVVGLEGGTTTENLTDGAAAARSREGSERTGIGRRRRETITMMGLREADGRRGIDTTVGWGERGRGLATAEVENANATIEEEEPREREEEALNRSLVVVNRSDTRWMVMMVDNDRGLSRRRGLGCRNNGGWRRESSWRVNGWNKTRRATRRRLDAMGITKNVKGKFTLGIYNLDKSVRRRCVIC